MTTDTGPQPRAAEAGDISPDLSEEGIERFEVGGAVEGAREATVNAVRDVLASAQPEEMAAVARWLDAVLAGTSPDDFGMLRRVILEQDEPVYGTIPMSSDDELVEHWRSGVYPYRNLMSRKSYEAQKYHLQVELLKLQAWVRESGQRVVVLFDRSWYNRAGVERVMNFCSNDELAEFLRQAPEFERNLTRSGVHLIKFWFSVSREEQRRRFREREKHPLKQWKLSPVDIASLDKWDEYTLAKQAMFVHSDTVEAPWTVIKSDCKKRARLNAIRYVLHKLPYAGKQVDQIGPLDPLIVGRAYDVYETGERDLPEV